MTNYPPIEFKRNAVDPIACLKGGWELVKDQYWLFVGMCAVGMIIASVVPLGIMMGPMMCGIYLTFFKNRKGQPIEFGTLFKGFDYFGQSVIAALLHIVPILLIFIPSYVIFYAIFLVTMLGQRGDPNPGSMLAFFGIFFVYWFIMVVIIMVISIAFTFAYPLIVDRGLSGVDAVKLSFRAAMANFWRLLGLSLLSAVLGFAGVILCYVGVFLVIPITLAAVAVAYEQVFGLGEPASNLPPPPPTFN